MELATFASNRTYILTDWPAVLYPASSGSLASSWSPGDTHGHWKFFHHRIVQVKGRTLNRAANWASPGNQLLDKEPENSGNKIDWPVEMKTIGKFSGVKN